MAPELVRLSDAVRFRSADLVPRKAASSELFGSADSPCCFLGEAGEASEVGLQVSCDRYVVDSETVATSIAEALSFSGFWRSDFPGMACFKPTACLLLLLLCMSAQGSQAQSDEDSAAIIQTTIMSFRLTGSAAGNFSTSTQTKFSDQLRALLQSFNFMSIAVSDFTVETFCCSMGHSALSICNSLSPGLFGLRPNRAAGTGV